MPNIFKNFFTPREPVEDPPQRKGLFRFAELLFTHFGKLVLLNILVTLCLVPACFCAFLAADALLAGFYGTAALFFGGCILAGLLSGGALSAGAFIISSFVRNAPVFLWHDFLRKFRDSFRQSAVMGITLCVMLGVQCYFLRGILEGRIGEGSLLPFIMLLPLFLECILFPLYFLQACYLDLPPITLLKNTLILSAKNSKRILLGAFFLLIISALIASLPYYTLLIPMLLISYSFAMLIFIHWAWVCVDGAYGIEEKLKEPHGSQE
jgi:uncharacterized membrane protein YesL